MRNTMKEISLYSFYDRTGIQKHLEEMAAKGWMLEKIGQFFWHYRRVEPKKLHFAVSYFPSASTFDPAPSENQVTYREFCEYSGWKLAADSAQLEVYWNEDENAVPLVTDPLVELETIHKSARKTIVLSSFLLLGIAFMQIGRFVYDYRINTISTFLDDTNLFMLICWFLIGLTSVVEIINYFVWYFEAKKAAETDGSFIDTKSRKRLMKCLLGVLVLMTICMYVSMATRFNSLLVWISIGHSTILFGIVLGVKNILKKNNASAKMNRTLTLLTCFLASAIATSFMAFLVIKNLDTLRMKEHEPIRTYEHEGWTFDVYQDELPLYLEEFIDVGDVEYSYEKGEKESIFLREVTGRQNKLHFEGDAPEMTYAIIDVKAPALYEDCVDYFLREASRYDETTEYRIVEDNRWDAENVYKLFVGDTYINTYLLCYENRIVRFTLYNLTLTNNDETVKIISEKLKPN